MTQAKLEPGKTATPLDIKGDDHAKHEKDPSSELGLTSPIKDSEDEGTSKESRDDQ